MEAPIRKPGAETTIAATSAWYDEDALAEVASQIPQGPNDKNPFYYLRGSLLLGETEHHAGALVGWNDDRHVITVAGSRAGKGRSAIIPNLRFYPGSIFCIDPKGENARETVAMREDSEGIHQKVYVLDPFKVSDVPEKFQASFNPLEDINTRSSEVLEQIGMIADSMVVASDPKNAHWDESARSLIEALIAHVISGNHDYSRTLSTVREFIRRGDRVAAKRRNEELAKSAKAGIEYPSKPNNSQFKPVDPFVALLDEMKENDAIEGIVSSQAHKLAWLGPDERGSILSFAERNTRFLDGQPMQRVLKRSARTLDLNMLKSSPQGVSVYLCLPARYMASHSRWLRLVLSSLMMTMERNKAKARNGMPVLAILDEFPILGNLKLVESAIGYMAGFGLKLWVILQDLSQLRRDYPDSWETFIGNAGVKQFFGNTDVSTLEYVSQLLGETEMRRVIVDESASTQNSKSRMSDADRRMRQHNTNYGDTHARELEQRSQAEIQSINNRTEFIRMPLMAPHEIALHFSAKSGRQLIVAAGEQPIILKRINHDELETCDDSVKILRKRNKMTNTRHS